MMKKGDRRQNREDRKERKDSELKEEKRDGEGEEKIKISWGNKIKEIQWKMELKERKERKRNVIIRGIGGEERRKGRELQGFSRN